MASATLNTLVAASKPAVTNSGGIAAALLAAADGGSATGAAGGTGALPGASGTGATAAPASIVDFLAMLSGMLETPATSAASGAAATAVNPNAIKSDPSQSGSGNDISELYAQLLALMQGGAGESVQAPTPTSGAGADGALAAATSPANAAGASAGTTASAAEQAGAQQTAAANQRDLIAKLLGQGAAGADDAAGDTDGSTANSGGKGIASLLEKDLQSLFGGGGTAGASGSGVSLSDLSALLGQGVGGANAGAAHTGAQLDPSLLQPSAAAAPATTAPATATPTADASAAHAHLTAPVGTAAWTEQLGTHLTWMAGNDQQSASLRLTPPHLGPLEVQITMGDDNKASVLFSAPHADTRAALGEALPRLRELFGASGLTLSDASVSREPSRQKPRSPTPDSSVSRVTAVSGDDAAGSLSARIAALHAGILDTYA